MDNTVIFEAAESFSVPNEIVDKYIEAPQNALRLILFMLRNKNSSFLTSEIELKLKMNATEIADALAYWEKSGVLYNYGGRYRLERPKVQPSDIIRYSPSTVANRLESDPAIAFLYKKTEQALARPLSADDAAAVLSLTDWVGLPPEVAALLIDHVTASGTKSMKKLLATASQWEEMGLTTFDKADAYVTEQNRKRSTERKTAALIGISGRTLSAEETELFNRWSEEFGFNEEMIKLAFSKTVLNTGAYKPRYMNSILTSWHESGYKTPSDIKDTPSDAGRQKKGAEKKPLIDAEAAESSSWDIITEALSNKSGTEDNK